MKSSTFAFLKVTFMLTNAFGFGRRRRSARAIDGQQQVSTRMLSSSNQLYQNLAQASGGQAIEVTKGTLAQATDIIAATSISTLVIEKIILSLNLERKAHR